MNAFYKTFAVFVLAKNQFGYAGTTRPDGKVGLPGGKIDQGEDEIQAVMREAKEEGWTIHFISINPIHSQLVDGKMVVWYSGIIIDRLVDYKEKSRGIKPVYLTKEEVKNSGFGNENLYLE
jgi:8-oxo-dGTP pyrophosphatase MutT (NUDIX family)